MVANATVELERNADRTPDHGFCEVDQALVYDKYGIVAPTQAPFSSSTSLHMRMLPRGAANTGVRGIIVRELYVKDMSS